MTVLVVIDLRIDSRSAYFPVSECRSIIASTPLGLEKTYTLTPTEVPLYNVLCAALSCKQPSRKKISERGSHDIRIVDDATLSGWIDSQATGLSSVTQAAEENGTKE